VALELYVASRGNGLTSKARPSATKTPQPAPAGTPGAFFAPEHIQFAHVNKS
jgi:hypothetical protein